MKILVITDCVPYPLISGDRIRLYNLLLRIAKKHDVWLITFRDDKDGTVELQQLHNICQQVEVVRLQHRNKSTYIPDLLKFGLTGKPLELVFYHSEDMKRAIQKLVSRVDFDIVQIEHSRMAIYLEALPKNLWSKCVLTFHNVEFIRLNRFFRIQQGWGGKIRVWLSGRMMRMWEPYCAENFGRCIVMSEVDRDLLAKANPRLQISVIANGVDICAFQPLPRCANPNNLIFVGSMDYGPCIDATLFFCKDVLPRIRRLIGQVELWVVGKNPPPKIIKLGGNGVHITGQVADVVPYYRQSAICVVPLRAGGGTRLKILEAMGLGRPVVSTTIGFEGLDVVDGEHILVGDDPETFAQQTSRLFKDQELYDCIAANARRLVVTRYNWDVIAEDLMDVYRQLE